MRIVPDLSPALQLKFESLLCQLSPENLCCDGELSHSQVVARSKAIHQEWAQLEAQAGRPVSQDEF